MLIARYGDQCLRHVFDAAAVIAPAAKFAEVSIAQDGEQAGAHQGVPHQVVDAVAASRQPARKGPELRNEFNELGAKLVTGG